MNVLIMHGLTKLQSGRLIRRVAAGGLLLCMVIASRGPVYAQAPPIVNPQSGSVGLQATMTSPPPKTGASISLPSNGQVFTSVPITVTGICPVGLLVKVFKNNVFGGSVQCANGSFSIQIDLFSGTNDLIARVYDNLDQPGPDSPTVTVTFKDSRTESGPRVSLTTNYAKRGANPGDKLSWPVTLSGGIAPYAVSVNWGDGKAPDLISRPFPGEFIPTHVYDKPGIYNIIVKATDKNGDAAFLQLVGVANGALSQENATGVKDEPKTIIKEKVIYTPFLIFIPLLFSSFWLGKMTQLRHLRKIAESHLE